MGVKDTIGGWIDGLSNDNKARAWQMVAHYQFNFEQEVVGAAKILERLLKAVPKDAVKNEFESLLALPRENAYSLAPLAAASEPLEAMLQSKTREYKPLFRGLDHAQAVREAYDRLNDKKRAANVPDANDFPTEPHELHNRAKELFDAILDFSDAEEKPRLVVKKTKKRKASEMEDNGDDGDDYPDNGNREFTENTAWKRIRNASDVEINLLAWNLLRRMRDAQNGIVGIGPWTTNWKYSQYTSFDERFKATKIVCRLSKTAVASMMSADDVFTKRLVAAPNKEIKQKRSNKSTNLKRDEQNKVALHCQSKGWVVKDASGRMVDSDGLVITPALPEQAASEMANGRASSVNAHTATAVTDTARVEGFQGVNQGSSDDNPFLQTSLDVMQQDQQDAFVVPQPSHGGFAHQHSHGDYPAANCGAFSDPYVPDENVISGSQAQAQAVAFHLYAGQHRGPGFDGTSEEPSTGGNGQPSASDLDSGH
ncbi:hypothetical protein GE09DRAFT_1185294 [Coniochaeta sp. 2T2.1]|nr:hypothetical protein GE09DRAFT_1185294 [Coniochaeta sp. 2T2.1]